MVKKLRGLTLLELIITVTITVVLAAGLFSAFKAGLSSYRKIERVSDMYQEARAFFERVETDIKNSYPVSKKDSGFNGDARAFQFYSVADTHDAFGKASLPYRISYLLQGKEVLRGRSGSELFLTSQQDQASGVVAQDVADISFQYAGASGNGDYEWRDSWGREGGQAGQFPLALKVKLLLFERPGSSGTTEFDYVCAFPLLY